MCDGPGGMGVCPGGVHLPLWTAFLTHTCENITFPQLCLRTVTMNHHLSFVSQTFVVGGLNLHEIEVISVTVMNFAQEFETNICVNTILSASTVKHETLIHFFCQVLKFKAVKFRLTECIPVGCVPPAAEAVCWGEGSASVHAGIHPCKVWTWRPPWCGPGDPPRCGPGDPPGQTPQLPPGCGPRDPAGQTAQLFPLGVGLETPLGETPQPPPGCGPGDLQGMLGYHPPQHEQTDTCKNITPTNFVCGR